MSSELKGMEIMVVDDTPDNLRLLVGILKQQDYKVRPVPSGFLALSAVKVSSPDLILLDINMPGMNGYEVCAKLKADDDTKEIPVIFLSAMNETIDKVKAFEVGGIDYITKPFHVEEVLARVKTHLNLYILQRQMEETNTNLEQIVKHRTEELLKLKIAKHSIELELNIAKKIQANILPKTSMEFNSENIIAVVADTKPARRIGGDFFDYCLLDNNKLFFCIGDVSGKGIPAAIFMAIIKTLIRVEAKRYKSPADIIVTVNNILYLENDTCMFASVFCALIDTVKNEIEYCNAGHTAPLQSHNGKEYKFMPLHNDTVVGIMKAEVKDYYTGTVPFAPGDRMFLYSDGITEAINVKKEEFHKERLLEALNASKGLSLAEVNDLINLKLEEFTGEEPQFDDITLLLLENKGKQS